MRLSPVVIVLSGFLAVSPAAQAEPFSFAAMGDTPYRLPDDMARFEQLVDVVNQRAPAFSIHVGDIKSGSSPCSDEALLAVRDRFMRFQGPLFYTPGDNEWTDCHRRKAGEFDPRERLSKLRDLFFAAPQSLGQTAMTYVRQSDSGKHTHMVENAVWINQDVLFATLHVVGSNNGLERNAASVAEYEARDAANKDWIKRIFQTAHEQNAAATVIAFHADPRFDVEKPWDYANSGFKKTLKALAKWAGAYDRPVLLIHGDSHRFIIDRPLRDKDGAAVANVMRLEVMGARDVGAVFVRVDTAANPPWAFEPVVVD